METGNRFSFWVNDPFQKELGELTDIAADTLMREDPSMKLILSKIDNPSKYPILINYEPNPILSEYMENIKYWGDVLKVDSLEKMLHIVIHYFDHCPSAKHKVARHLEVGEKVIFVLVHKIEYIKTGTEDNPKRSIHLDCIIYLIVPQKIIVFSAATLANDLQYFLDYQFRIALLN